MSERKLRIVRLNVNRVARSFPRGSWSWDTPVAVGAKVVGCWLLAGYGS